MQIYSIKNLNDQTLIDQQISVRGWLKFNRVSGKIAFIELNDGSYLKNLQIVYKVETLKNYDEISKLRIGSAILVSGVLKRNNRNPELFEVLAEQIEVLKSSDEDYPLQKKEHSMEFLREIAHLRVRTTTMQAIMRVRSVLAYEIHQFFNENDFAWVAAPIITSNDAEGAGENFVIAQDEKKPFFDKEAKLTVSGQLNAEAYAQGLQKVYTFGPTFRAENSHTNRHLAEFWMIEPEIAFINLEQLKAIIEVFIKTIVQRTYEKCQDEFAFFIKQDENKTTNKINLEERISKLINSEFVHLDYKKAIELLKKAVEDKVEFEDKDIFFGKDLASEHERYLCEKVYNAPVFLYNFPKEIKAFYMKLNADNKTVAATDLLVPGVGEIVGGSQRESNFDLLNQRVKELKIDATSIEWYLNLRRYGYSSSAGFGLGFERLIMYILGLENIKDTIPFPRTPGKISF